MSFFTSNHQKLSEKQVMDLVGIITTTYDITPSREEFERIKDQAREIEAHRATSFRHQFYNNTELRINISTYGVSIAATPKHHTCDIDSAFEKYLSR